MYHLMYYDMSKGITIHLSKETKGRLDKLKFHQREPYEEVIRRVLNNMKGNECNRRDIKK